MSVKRKWIKLKSIHLSVGNNCSIVPIYTTFHKRFYRIENRFLIGCYIKDGVVRKSVGTSDPHLSRVIRAHTGAFLTIFDYFSCIAGTDSKN
jgi:hypothetical protein